MRSCPSDGVVQRGARLSAILETCALASRRPRCSFGFHPIRLDVLRNRGFQ